ncbi:MAG: adenosylcobalamin-dependent ribonucleoside-diphosphate reductase [Planctomycetota bacterium]|nr:adenosylcobalamin-dependent ribonucleoside-diphosphate reductase [Planctomycetota bacterium]
MKIVRKFTVAGQNPFDSVTWVKRSSKISNPDGSVVFEMKDAEVPERWSQLATDIMVSKYFRKAGVPQDGGPNGLPSPGVEKKAKATGADGRATFGPEKSAKQVIHRLAGCWRHWGETHNYFDTKEDAQAFYDELVYMMVHQMCAPNSPQWFNTGLNWAYGISGPAQGHWIVDPKTGEVKLADDAYSHPQPHACFIQSVSDDLVNDGGIMDLWVREARLFKYGSGTGTNFSRLRGDGESLSGGGKSSGLMSWLKIGDRAASAIKSGGTTRRAAKMVCLDMDHPDILEFINWKVREEIKVQAMVEGLRYVKKHDASTRELCDKMKLNLDFDFNGESYLTVSGQNSNNSVRIPDSFFDAVDAGGEWKTFWRTNAKVAKTYKATDVWDAIAYAAWRCADPGVQYDTTINAWHTCPSAGRINASNPCSEYMFLDNTACNLASLNVLKFFSPATLAFDVDRFEHGVDLWTTVLEISVLMASFPSKPIAELSYRYRTLGLGYANLGAMLMQAGIPYDSDEGRSICAMLTSILCGRSYRMSAVMAKQLGAFAGYEADKANMLRVMRNHQRAAHGIARDSGAYEGLRIPPVPIDHAFIDRAIARGTISLTNAKRLLEHAVKAWDEAVALGEKHGYRNAQVTVIAPTGTIGLLMDCDTTGVEPDFALVKFKKLAGGGYFKIANESVAPALRTLGYSETQVRDIMRYVLGSLDLDVPMPAGSAAGDAGEKVTFAQWLRSKGFRDADLKLVSDGLPGVFELSFAFSAWSLSDELLTRMGFEPAKVRGDVTFDLLRALGLDSAQAKKLNEVVCGTSTIEGAPHLKPEHLPVFDCANKCGRLGTRFIAPDGHTRMMAAAQPFISGAISKTINLPNEATVEDVKASYRLSWELGLKANALYRDGCKLSQPLSSTSDQAKEEVAREATQTQDAQVEDEARKEVVESVVALASAATRGDAAQAVERIVEIVHRPMRRRLPDTRSSLTHKFNVAGHEGYLTVGLYEDGKPGELFITMSKEGSTIGGLMDSLGTATSVALQYGVPVESLVSKFSFQRFEPAGMTENPEIPFAKSLVDYIFRWMGMQFIPGYRESHAPDRGSAAERATGNMSTLEPTREGGFSMASVDPDQSDSSNGLESKERQSDTEVTRWSKEPFSGSRAAARDVGARAARHLDEHPHGQRSQAPDATHAPGGARDSARPVSDRKPQAATLSVALESVGDAPACDVCGTITVRSGVCYKCLNCGNSMGCS